jgi:pimeloyl-ACP methyl ester carboxylesterase
MNNAPLIPNSTLGDLCAAAYWQTNLFDTIIAHQDKNACYIGIKKYDNCIVAACRGSDDFQDWWHDFYRLALMERDPDLGPIHPGGIIGVRAALAALVPLIDRPLVITGHSLGAMHAADLAALYIVHHGPVAKYLTLGPPRPGAGTIKNLLSEIPDASAWQNLHDIVACVPFAIPGLEPYCEPIQISKLAVEPPPENEWPLDIAPHHCQLYNKGLHDLDGTQVPAWMPPIGND